MPRTRLGIIFEENSGAMMNSGVTRASTMKNAATWAPPIPAMSWLTVDWLTADQPPTSCGIELNRFCV